MKTQYTCIPEDYVCYIDQFPSGLDIDLTLTFERYEEKETDDHPSYSTDSDHDIIIHSIIAYDSEGEPYSPTVTEELKGLILEQVIIDLTEASYPD